jgi:hypothetical protein
VTQGVVLWLCRERREEEVSRRARVEIGNGGCQADRRRQHVIVTNQNMAEGGADVNGDGDEHY